MKPITILLIDDHRLIRETWSQLLNNETGFQVIGTASTAEEGIEMAKTQSPAIVLMDINMDPMNGFDATRAIRKYSPGSKVIGVSMHALPVYAKKIIKMGAVGYITKNSSADELIKAILEVNAGKKFICEEIKDILSHQELDSPDHHSAINTLSKREIEIAKMIKEAMSSRDIATHLGLSPKTVEAHRYNILKKLQLNNTAALVNLLNEYNI
ncbi:MAG: response regulator transcription factor [Bacteroidota bacterium]